MGGSSGRAARQRLPDATKAHDCLWHLAGVQVFDVRFQGMNRLGPIGACLIRAGPVSLSAHIHEALGSWTFSLIFGAEKIAGLQDHTALPSTASAARLARS